MDRNSDLNEERNNLLVNNRTQQAESGEDIEHRLASGPYEDDEEMEIETEGRQVIELFDDDDMNIAENKVGHGGEEEEKMDLDAGDEQLPPPEEQEIETQSSKVRSGAEYINFECERKDTNFIVAPGFVLSLFKVTRKINKVQYVCEECYDKCTVKYQDLCKIYAQKHVGIFPGSAT